MSRTILVVEDSPTEMQIVKNALQSRGYNVITAANGEEGIEKAHKERPQLVVLDIILPGKNGYQVCRDLKSSPDTKDVPVIMLTSKSQESDRFWGMKQGADAYLTKPWREDELLATVARHL
ncbi:MAG: response regulator [Acidobacteriota bacterium]|jgi:twitching motility two-component system response regulator PilH